jgi:hypothetical protein
MDALKHAGVEWCVLRGEDSLLAPTNDVDLLVSAREESRLRDVLGSAGFAEIPLRSRHRRFVGYDEGRDSWLVLDVVHELVFGPGPGIRIAAVDDILAACDQSGPARVLKKDDRFWTGLLHEMLDRSDARPSALADLASASSASRVAGAVARALDQALRNPWTAECLLALARQGRWDDLRGTLHAQVATLSPARRLKRTVTRPVARMGVLCRRRGMTVAILGPDGAGKSTLASGLAEHAILPARILYMGMQAGASIPGKTWEARSVPGRRRGPHRRLRRQALRLTRLARRSLLAHVERSR